MTRPPAGAPPVERSAAVARTDGRKDIANYLELVKAFERPDRRDDLRAMLGSEDLVARFLAVALNAISTDSDLLMNASPASIIQAVRDSATLGLEPTGLTGEGVIIRYGVTAKFMPMYRGYLKRIYNTGKIQVIDAQVVYANDEFEYGYTEKGGWFTHNPARPTNQTGLDEQGESERGDYWGAYAYARKPDGFVHLVPMPAVEINDIRDKFSPSVKANKPGPWDTSWGEMAKKTCIRRLAKLLPQSASDELSIAVNQLLAADAAADAAKDEAEQNGAGRLDVSKARRAALAAVAGRSGQTDLPEPPQIPSGLPEEPLVADSVTVQDAPTEPEADSLPLFDQEPTDEP